MKPGIFLDEGTMIGFKRARTEEQVASRQEEIISAADMLFSQAGYEGVHFKAISKLTSCKRPTIYLYYKTKDEILLDLLKREMLEWDAVLRAGFAAAASMTKNEFCVFLAETIAPREKMLRLFAILCTNIENQCRLEKLVEFKKEAPAGFIAIGAALEKFFPRAGIEKVADFMVGFLTYMHGLFPLAYPSQKQLDAMALAGMEYRRLDFKASFYQGILLLAADL